MNNTSKDEEGEDMEPEYDYSQGVRGKFYSPDTVLHLPIYLDPDVEQYIRALAGKTGHKTDELVNEWLRNTIGILRSVE